MQLFESGQAVTIQHRKPWKQGSPIQLRGWVHSFDGSLLVLRRQFRSPGRKYDGLDALQEPGDNGTVELCRGAWISRRRYLRADGSLIGELYNVQTATDFHPGVATYLDLEIDVGYLPNREDPVVIQDVEELRAAESAGHIPPEVANIASQLAKELARRMTAGDTDKGLFWDVRPTPAALAATAVQTFLKT